LSFAGSFSGRVRAIWGAVCAALMLCAVAPAKTAKSVPTEKTATTHSSTNKASTKSASKSKTKKSKKKSSASTRRGQKNIDPQRAQAIQEALIREHYLDGKATGVWDNDSQKAMERFQADNNWQCKQVPDSRALIKLGLGPDHEHLLNPESAMTMEPSSTRASTSTSPAMDAVSGSRPQK